MPTNGLIIALSIAIIVIGLVLILLLAAMTILILAIKNLITELREHADPLVTSINSLLLTAKDVAETVQVGTERIATQAAHTTEVVGGRVEGVSGLLHRMTTGTLIQGMAFMRGVRAGVAAWRTARRPPATP